MTNAYEILFSVDIKHDFYMNGICTDFTIRPSGETALLLKNLGLLYKNIGNRLVILAKVKQGGADAGKMFVDIDKASRFVFYLELNKPEFTSYTNIDLEKLKTNRFYFSNLSANIFNTEKYLSINPAPYSNSRRYFPGEMVTSSGNIFECIKETLGNNIASTAFWFRRQDFQYANSADLVRTCINTINYFDDTSTTFNINVFGLDTVTQTYSASVFSTTKNFVTPPSDFQITLPDLPKAKYRVTINSDEFFIYLDEEIVYHNYLGVIEIFSHLAASDNFSFVTANNEPQATEFIIRFANRLAVLKYHSLKNTIKDVKDTSAAYSFIQFPARPAAAEYFQPTVPVPLMQYAGRFQFYLNNSGTLFSNAPGPDVGIPGSLTRLNPGDSFECNIYLNY